MAAKRKSRCTDLLTALAKTTPESVWKIGLSTYIHASCLHNPAMWKVAKNRHRTIVRRYAGGLTEYTETVITKPIVVFTSYNAFLEDAENESGQMARRKKACPCGRNLSVHSPALTKEKSP